MTLNKRTALDRHSSNLQSLALDLSFSVLDEFFLRLDERLMEEFEAVTHQQQWQVMSLARTIQSDKAKLSQLFENEIMDGFVQFRLGRLGGANTQAEDQSICLSLIATEELERDLALTSLARRAETQYMESLFSLNQRLAVVNGGKKLAEDGNPLGPAQFSAALGHMLVPLELDTKYLVLFSRVFEPVLIQQLESLYEKSNGYLIEAGILPNLRYEISKVKQSPTSAASTAPDSVCASPAQVANKPAPAAAVSSAASAAQSDNKPGPANDALLSSDIGDADYQHRMFDAIRQLQNQTAGSVTPTLAEGNEALLLSGLAVAPSSKLVSVIDASTDTGHHVDALEAEHVNPLTVEHYQTVARQIQEQIGQEHRIDSNDRNAIDLVGLIFEYMLGDDLLPDSLKAVLSYLHTPFLKIALLDPVFFEQADHPARQLLNLLAETGRRWVNSDGDSQFKIFPKIKAIVRRAVMDAGHDLALYDELLLEMQQFYSKIKHKIELLEKRAQEKAQGEERLRESKRRVYREIKRRIDQRPLPPAVTVLLLHPWADFMTFELLRFGEASKQWRHGLQLVEDVLWSLRPKTDDDARSRLILMQPILLAELKEAIKSISFNQPKALKLLAILEDLQNQALAAYSVAAAQSSSVAAISPMKSRIAGSEEFNEKAYPEEVFDDQDESLFNAAEKEIVEHLKHIDFGTQFEFDEYQGKSNQRLRVAWYNLKTMRYMLVDNAGRKVKMTSAIDIARLILASHARMISGSTKPFFEGAGEYSDTFKRAARLMQDYRDREGSYS